MYSLFVVLPPCRPWNSNKFYFLWFPTKRETMSSVFIIVLLNYWLYSYRAQLPFRYRWNHNCPLTVSRIWWSEEFSTDQLLAPYVSNPVSPAPPTCFCGMVGPIYLVNFRACFFITTSDQSMSGSHSYSGKAIVTICMKVKAKPQFNVSLTQLLICRIPKMIILFHHHLAKGAEIVKKLEWWVLSLEVLKLHSSSWG